MTREEAIMIIQAIPECIWKLLSKTENEAIEMAIESLGNDTNVGSKWIPCSERLPSETEAWYFNKQEGIHEPNEFIVQVKGAKLPTVAIFNGESFTHICTDDGYGFIDEIIAWQPLPEPYKEGET